MTNGDPVHYKNRAYLAFSRKNGYQIINYIVTGQSICLCSHKVGNALTLAYHNVFCVETIILLWA